MDRNEANRTSYEWQYDWTTSEGPPDPIKTGTLCSGDLIVKKQKLISLLIPALEPYFEVTVAKNPQKTEETHAKISE